MEIPETVFLKLQNTWGGSDIPREKNEKKLKSISTDDTKKEISEKKEKEEEISEDFPEFCEPQVCTLCSDRMELLRRKKKEKREIVARDSQTKEREDDFWFLISEKWLSRWRTFINGTKTCENC